MSDGDCLSSDIFGDAILMSFPLSTLELVRGESPLLDLLRVGPGMVEVAGEAKGNADAPSGWTSCTGIGIGDGETRAIGATLLMCTTSMSLVEWLELTSS